MPVLGCSRTKMHVKLNVLTFQGYEDPHKTLPSVVVHVRGLVDGVTEGDLCDALKEFGEIR